MRYFLAVFCFLFGVCFAQAADWEKVGRVEAKGRITWLDLSRSGSEVGYVTDQAECWVYDQQQKDLHNLSPRSAKGQKNYVTKVVFEGQKLVTYGDMKQIFDRNERLVSSREFGDFLQLQGNAFASDGNGEIHLVYWTAAKEGNLVNRKSNDLGASVVHLLNGSKDRQTFSHGAPVEVAVLNPKGTFAFSAGGGMVRRWTTTPIAFNKNQDQQRARGSFPLPDKGVVVDMAASADGEFLAVAMQNGRVTYAKFSSEEPTYPMKGIRRVPLDASRPIVNHRIALTGDGQHMFAARANSTGKKPVVEIVRLGPKTSTEEQVYVQSENGAGIVRLHLIADKTLAWLNVSDAVGFIPLKSGMAQLSASEVFATDLPGAVDCVISGDGHVVVAYNHDAFNIYRQKVGAEVAGTTTGGGE